MAKESTFARGGATNQEAPVYAGKVVEANATDPKASIIITHDGEEIGPAATVGEMPKRAI